MVSLIIQNASIPCSTETDYCMIIDVKVFGFLTIPEDATIGVSAHEIGHLRKHHKAPVN